MAEAATRKIIASVGELADEGLSATQIGLRLGLSKGAVSGIVHRNQIRLTRKPGGHDPTKLKAVRVKRDSASATPKPPSLPRVRVTLAPRCGEDGQPITFETAGARDCLWMDGEPTWDAQVCGHPRLPEVSYCAHHAARARGKAAA